MKNKKVKGNEVLQDGNSRRKFLKVSGLAVAGSGLLIGCSSDDDFSHLGEVPEVPPEVPGEDEPFDLGSGNLGILNYAYALEQLEAAFYTAVLEGGYYASANANEKQILDDVYNHEVIHREFFKTAINGADGVSEDMVLPELEFDFSSVNFDDETDVLTTSVQLEDTGVMAYNGAGKLIDASDGAGKTYLELAGKIVSVEARHASAFRNLVNPGSMDFAGDDVLIGLMGTDKAFDKATPPADILAAVGELGFITTEFTADNLPTS